MFQEPGGVATAGLKLVSQHAGRLHPVGLELRLEILLSHAAKLEFQVQGVDGVEDVFQRLVVGRGRALGGGGHWLPAIQEGVADHGKTENRQ